MIKIPKDELLESLKYGYMEYRDCLANGSDEVDLAHIKGYCTTIEQILNAYGGISSDEMMKIKKPLIGEVSLRRGKKQDRSINYDIPTIFRKNTN
jgi:hypothetical protein